MGCTYSWTFELFLDSNGARHCSEHVSSTSPCSSSALAPSASSVMPTATTSALHFFTCSSVLPSLFILAAWGSSRTHEPKSAGKQRNRHVLLMGVLWTHFLTYLLACSLTPLLAHLLTHSGAQPGLHHERKRWYTGTPHLNSPPILTSIHLPAQPFFDLPHMTSNKT